MDDALVNIGFLINRYLHIVCTAVLVGGTLFYEMVVPVAIGELKNEQQLAVFARARWVFRQIVWASAAVLVISGIVSSWRHWETYTMEPPQMVQVAPDAPPQVDAWREAKRPGWWWVAHISTGTMAVVIALFLTIGGRPPDRPIQWMRLNLTILLIVIFLATVTRHTRLILEQTADTSATPVQPNSE
jgi:hypothetical protein